MRLNDLSTKPTIGINVRSDGDVDYADLIVDGRKKYESRRTDSLRPYVGKTVAIVKTGKGQAVAIGQAKVGEPIVVDAFKFGQLRKQHLVPAGSKFDIDVGGEKYLYPMIDPVRWDEPKLVKNKGIVARRVDESTLTEYRRRLLDYLYKLLPKWPPYVVRDWLYQGYRRHNFSEYSDVESGVNLILGYAGLDADTKWRYYPNFEFKQGIWEPKTEQLIKERIGGKTFAQQEIPNDAARHATQAELLQQRGVSQEPVIILDSPNGYELVEGWHRTVQHFKQHPKGYTGPAWVAISDQVR